MAGEDDETMGLLLFKKVFAEAIVSGGKTTTLRRWDRARCRAGQRVFAPGVGYLRVRSVERVRLAGLSREDARADGFGSVRSLRRTLAGMYSGAGRAKPLWRVEFEFEGPPGGRLGSR